MNTLSFGTGPNRVTSQGVAESLEMMVRVAGEAEVKVVVRADS